jgi:hypothetical protein
MCESGTGACRQQCPAHRSAVSQNPPPPRLYCVSLAGSAEQISFAVARLVFFRLKRSQIYRMAKGLLELFPRVCAAKLLFRLDPVQARRPPVILIPNEPGEGDHALALIARDASRVHCGKMLSGTSAKTETTDKHWSIARIHSNK